MIPGFGRSEVAIICPKSPGFSDSFRAASSIAPRHQPMNLAAVTTGAGGPKRHENWMLHDASRTWLKGNSCTIWLFNIAMENGPFIDGLPIKNGDFPWLC